MPQPFLSRAAANLRRLAGDIATCLSFFSRLPVTALNGGSGATSRRSFAEAVGVLPLAGLLIGGCGTVPLLAAAAAGLPAPLAATLAGTGLILATGGLHEDGLADMADGFGGGATRERKLAIMRDSRIGSYGVLALAIALLLRFGALAAILERSGPAAASVALLAACGLSRGLALLPLTLLPPARPDGLGRSVGRPSQAPLAACFCLAALIGLLMPPLGGLGLGHASMGSIAAAAAAGAVTWLARRHIGGHTGDIGGASQQASEAAYLVGLLLFSDHA